MFFFCLCPLKSLTLTVLTGICVKVAARRCFHVCLLKRESVHFLKKTSEARSRIYHDEERVEVLPSQSFLFTFFVGKSIIIADYVFFFFTYLKKCLEGKHFVSAENVHRC